MAAIPGGVTTFLFTDIEGSTRLVQRLGPRYPSVLKDHNGILDSAVNEGHGTIVDRAGDGVFAVFSSPLDALRASLSAQRAIAAHPWPDGGAVRVRIGMHVGQALHTDTGFTGLDVHRAARIASVGNGGQILLSDQARVLLEGIAPSDVGMRDLGSHRLKDLDQPERIFQAEVPDLPADFAPIRSLDTRPHNLPSELTEFIGRDAERRAVDALLERHRLVTLVGSGGTGKTRLALRVAADTLPAFSHGVFFVPLEAVREASAVPLAIARHMAVERVAPTLDLLAEYLSDREMLLVLDNFEQVLPGVHYVARLLESAPRIKVLVTSRTRLNARGEHVFEVPPMAVPDPTAADDPERLRAIDSVELFVRRAQAVNPQFALSSTTGPAIAQIVARLEGLPLAIELAAARARLLPAEELASRLGDALGLLQGGPVDLPTRHQTIRGTIAWSHDLLTEPQRAIFRRLSVFAVTFSIDAAEQVTVGAPVEDVIDLLGSLLDHSLLQSRIENGQTRFRMLEIVRSFAIEQLAQAGETEEIHRRHETFFLDLAEKAEPHLTGKDQAVWIHQLSADRDNLRAALIQAIHGGTPDQGLLLAGASWRFWQAVGAASEVRRLLGELLAATGASTEARAKGLTGAAGLAYWQADYAAAEAEYEEALKLYETMHDRFGVADTLFSLSVTATWSGNHKRGAELADAALRLFHDLGARREVGMVLMARGFARWMEGDVAGARPLWQESLAVAIELGDQFEAATKRLAIASLAFQQGDPFEARGIARGALDELVQLGNVTGMIMALDWVAALAAPLEPAGAVRLAGAADALRARLGGGMRPEDVGLPAARSQVSDRLPVDAIEEGWLQGEAMSLDEAVDLARQLVSRW